MRLFSFTFILSQQQQQLEEFVSSSFTSSATSIASSSVSTKSRKTTPTSFASLALSRQMAASVQPLSPQLTFELLT